MAGYTEMGQFDTVPVNALQALMLGDEGFKNARAYRQDNLQQAARRDAGDALTNGGDTRSALARLFAAGDIQGAQVLGTLGKADATDEIKEYNLSKSQGFTGSFTDWKTGLKRAGATNVSVNSKMETEYDKATGKEFAEQNIGMVKGAQAAHGKIATLDRLGQLLNDPNIYTGSGANLVTDAKRLAKSVGIDVGDVSGAEAVRAIGNQFALELRNPAGGAGMPGALSDKDREFLQASVPGLQQTPGGNTKIIDYMKRVANRAVQVDKLRQDYIRGPGKGRIDEGFYRTLSDYSEKNPLFSDGASPQQSGRRQGGGGAPPMGGARQGVDGQYYVPDPNRPGKYLRVVE